MHSELNFKQSLWEKDVFGRLTPPPEEFLQLEQEFLFVKPQQVTSCCSAERRESDPNTMEVEACLLDLEFESICEGELDGFKCGPTLAELNDTRSRSPLINPEMKRLHQVALQNTTGTAARGGNKTSSEGSACETTVNALTTRTHSVLEQQLRTQPLASICHEQFYPSRGKGAVKFISSGISASEPLAVATVASQQCKVAPSRTKTEYSTSCSTAVKPESSRGSAIIGDVESFKVQSVAPQLISPHMANNYAVSSSSNYIRQPAVASASASAVAQIKVEERLSSSSCEAYVSDDILLEGACTYETSKHEQYDPSEDEDDDSDEDMDETEEYCPFEKGVKSTPARRKGRRSESEDMVPNPAKLLSIVRELDSLNKIISSLRPINEQPQHSRGKSRKEKNKLASRACRLKKKQQHEANKLKLFGLESERENLKYIVNDMKKEIVSWARLPQRPANSLNEKIKHMEKKAFSEQIAGHTTDYVRKVLKEVAKGNQTGGLRLPKST